jgi:hypothetical protein
MMVMVGQRRMRRGLLRLHELGDDAGVGGLGRGLGALGFVPVKNNEILLSTAVGHDSDQNLTVADQNEQRRNLIGRALALVRGADEDECSSCD